MNLRISFATIAVLATLSLTACSVEYRARHPRHKPHNKVIVVGKVIPAIPVDSIRADVAQQHPLNKTYDINFSKSQ